MRKLEIESWEELMAKEFASFDVVDDDVWPEEQGYVIERNGHRWELDPASAEDYFERTHTVAVAQRWRHFGH